MRLLVLCFLFGFFQGFSQNNNIYSNQITTQDGQVYNMAQFKGRKIIVVILPKSRSLADSLTVLSLDSFSRQNAGQVYVIGVVPIVSSSVGDSASVLNNWYKKIFGNNLIITNSGNLQKSSTHQDQVFTWLTHAASNGHFDQDITGPGQVYFINESGQLYGMISSDTKYTNRILNKMIQTN